MRVLTVLLTSAVLAGCASPSLYQWGGYEPMLYQGYKDPAQMDVMRVKLEAHISELEKSRQKVAPGLYAELGTLYLQSGSRDKAVAMYSRERDVWPESRGLMDTLIKNLDRKEADKAEDAK